MPDTHLRASGKRQDADEGMASDAEDDGERADASASNKRRRVDDAQMDSGSNGDD